MKSLQNFLLLLACLAYALIRGSARQIVRTPKRICVIQLAQLGDMICTTPVFRAIKKTYPSAKLYVVGKPINREVLRGNKDIDEYVVWEENPITLIHKLGVMNCDYGITVGPNFIALAIMFLAGVKSITGSRIEQGSSPLETRPYRILRHLTHIVPHILSAYAPREYLKLLGPIDIVSNDTQKHLHYTLEALRSVESKLGISAIGLRSFAIIAPGAGHRAKRWPSERFAEVAEYLAAHYMPVVVIGAFNDAHDVETMMRNVNHSDIVDFSKQLSIEELKALISKASLFISVDTGPLYTAEAFGVPTIDIVGPVDERVQPPIGPQNLIVVPRRNKPAAMTMFNTRVIDLVEAKLQAEATQAEEVISAVDKLLASRKNPEA